MRQNSVLNYKITFKGKTRNSSTQRDKTLFEKIEVLTNHYNAKIVELIKEHQRQKLKKQRKK